VLKEGFKHLKRTKDLWQASGRDLQSGSEYQIQCILYNLVLPLLKPIFVTFMLCITLTKEWDKTKKYSGTPFPESCSMKASLSCKCLVTNLDAVVCTFPRDKYTGRALAPLSLDKCVPSMKTHIMIRAIPAKACKRYVRHLADVW